ncbi:MAG: hypothetical protein ABI620_06945 [Chloroflexota bacterium]
MPTTRSRDQDPEPLAPLVPAALPVTGVASGGLGTAANLEDTQLWDLQDLREPDLAHDDDALVFEDVPRGPGAHVPVAAAPPLAVARPLTVATPLAQPFAVAPARVALPAGQLGPRASSGRRRTGLTAVVIAGFLAVAVLLAARDGLFAGGTSGSGAVAFPSVPATSTAAPAPTGAPTKAPDGGGKGKGNGGKGNGNGGGGGGGGRN